MVSPDHCRAVDVAAIELWRVGRFMIVPRWWWGRAGAAAWVVGFGCRLGLSAWVVLAPLRAKGRALIGPRSSIIAVRAFRSSRTT